MEFSFTTAIARHDEWQSFHVVPVPDRVSDQLRDASVIRLIATFDSIELRRAIIGPHDGGRFLYISKPILKQLRKREGDSIEVKLTPDPDPDFVDLPIELEEALAQDAAAKKRWDTFTKGRQRSLAHFVNTAKRSETRIRRAVQLAEKIRLYTLSDDKPRDL